MAALTVSRTRRRLFVAHAAVVIVLTALFYVSVLTADPEGGVDIGAGLLALPLLPLGLPWSLPAIIDPYQFDGLSPALWGLVTFGPAVLNVLIHAAVLYVASRRRRA